MVVLSSGCDPTGVGEARGYNVVCPVLISSIIRKIAVNLLRKMGGRGRTENAMSHLYGVMSVLFAMFCESEREGSTSGGKYASVIDEVLV